ncbi:MAG: insulinase family protein [Desulfobacteraceae bacterium]|nr:MAG: insulinase family protein [Desulfobacteraceae bacterium]
MSRPENKTTLDNGIRIITHNMPYSRSVSMSVLVNVGARDELPVESGLSHFIEHMLFKGTKRRSSFEIAKEFDAMGGNANAFTSMETTCYHTKVITSHTAAAADILSDIVLNSAFDPEEIEKEKPVIVQEIGMVEENPEDYIHVLAGRCCWGDNPLGSSVLGTRESIAGFDSDKIKEYIRSRYQPQRTFISVAGNIEHNHILDIIGPAFESAEKRSDFPERSIPEVNKGLNIYEKDIEQAHICVFLKGLSLTDPDRYAFSLLNTVIGGNMSSRLFQEIREKRGLAYSVYSFISSYADTGMFGAYAAVDPANAVEAADLIIRELRKIKLDAISSGELKAAIEYSKGCLLLASESTDNQMFRQAQNEMNFGRFMPLDEVINEMESVKESEILNLAGRLCNTNSLGITILGPVSGEKQFKDLMVI